MSKDNKGFTMVEILVGFLLLMIGGTSILMFQLFFFQYNIVIQDNQKARTLGEQFAEQVKARSYASAFIFDDTDTSDLNDFSSPDHSDIDTLDGRVFNLDWNVKESSGLKTIKVRISWARNKRDYEYEFITFKSQ